MTARTCPWPIAKLLPHAEPMLLLDEAVQYDEVSLTASVHVRNLQPFFSEGALPSYFGIELMAQTCGAYVGAHAMDEAQPVKIGYLLGTRHYETRVAAFDANQRLTVTATVVFRDDNMGVFDCRIETKGECVATARLNVYQPRNPVPGMNETQADEG
jgi:predicted hotdog family 3-hydroxylacyl-ACP dehydratase